MRKQTKIFVVLSCTLLLAFASCTRKARCRCVIGGFEVTTPEAEYDNKQDFQDAKEACESNGCEFLVG